MSAASLVIVSGAAGNNESRASSQATDSGVTSTTSSSSSSSSSTTTGSSVPSMKASASCLAVPVWKSNFGRPTSARWRVDSTPSTRGCLHSCVCSMAFRLTKVSATNLKITHCLIPHRAVRSRRCLASTSSAFCASSRNFSASRLSREASSLFDCSSTAHSSAVSQSEIKTGPATVLTTSSVAMGTTASSAAASATSLREASSLRSSTFA
mmetsp:Transcript_8280/g.20818  ORF Transcript_8280/g.20818 Transcript_8280/m.20818 type:complete len:210 (+) Transcript_8280:1276-1905(+)